MSQFLICQQDNYNGEKNLCADFILTLHTTFANERFMYIMHDKETDLHIHAILITSLDKTKSDILKVFPFADVQYQRANNKQSYNYLVHKTKKCIRENKTPYDEKNITFHNINDIWLVEWLQTTKKDKLDIQDEREILDEIANDIIGGAITTYQECLLKYKGVALKYYKSINDVLSSCK